MRPTRWPHNFVDRSSCLGCLSVTLSIAACPLCPRRDATMNRRSRTTELHGGIQASAWRPVTKTAQSPRRSLEIDLGSIQFGVLLACGSNQLNRVLEIGMRESPTSKCLESCRNKGTHSQPISSHRLLS
jgi:hypothetical protein